MYRQPGKVAPLSAEEVRARARHELAARVTRILGEQLSVDEKDIRPEATFVGDLNTDSLCAVEVALAFEEAFEIDIPDEDVERIRTVQDAIDYIEARTMKKK